MSDARSFAVPRPVGPRDLADWLLAQGRHWITTAEAADVLGVPRSHVSPSLARWRKRGLLFSPTTGVYVPIPPEFRAWSAVPASHFVDPLMRYLGHDYYVGLLSAAEAHGFAHQRPQVFQVVTSARLRDRSFGRVRVTFITSAATRRRPVVEQNTPTGTMRLSTMEVTALDLVSMPRRSGGLSNVATILAGMVEDDALDVSRLGDVAAGYPVAVAQRAGWLLERMAQHVGRVVDVDGLLRLAASRAAPTVLDIDGSAAGALDERWNVLVNTAVEPDL